MRKGQNLGALHIIKKRVRKAIVRLGPKLEAHSQGKVQKILVKPVDLAVPI